MFADRCEAFVSGRVPHLLSVFKLIKESMSCNVSWDKEEKIKLQIGEQNLNPIVSSAGKFFGPQRILTFQKMKIYCIVQTFGKLEYLFWGATQTHINAN